MLPANLLTLLYAINICMFRYHFTFFGMNHHVDRNKATACKLKAIYYGDVDRGSSGMSRVFVEFTAFAQKNCCCPL